MNLFKKPVLMILAALLFGAATMGAWAADTASADVSALRAVDDAWMKAYNAGDADAVTALYADDATLMPPDVPAAQGQTAIHSFFVTDVAASQRAGYKFSITGTTEGGIAGDWGWASGAYAVTDKTGATIDSGKYLSVYKNVGGKWVYVRDLWSSDKAKH